MKKKNKINLVLLNPNVTLADKDELCRPLSPINDTLLNTVTSKEFQDLSQQKSNLSRFDYR
jgi:hypothetical protein